MTEGPIQRESIKALRRLGFWVIRMGVSRKRGKGGTHSGEKGMPDTRLMGLGWLEFKADERAELSDDQLAWHAKARAAGERVDTVWGIAQALAVGQRWRDDQRAIVAALRDLPKPLGSAK